MHLPEGFTKVEIERFEGLGLADGGVIWDIPTDAIPVHLRAIGSRFVIVGEFRTPTATDSAEDVRAMARQRPEVHELDEP